MKFHLQVLLYEHDLTNKLEHYHSLRSWKLCGEWLAKKKKKRLLVKFVTYLLFIASRNPSNTDCILKLREETKLSPFLSALIKESIMVYGDFTLTIKKTTYHCRDTKLLDRYSGIANQSPCLRQVWFLRHLPDFGAHLVSPHFLLPGPFSLPASSLPSPLLSSLLPLGEAVVRLWVLVSLCSK